MLQQLTIIAPGLLGASLGMAAKHLGLVQRVHVWARRIETRLECEAQPWCDAVFAEPAEAADGAALVVICTPVGEIARYAAMLAPRLRPGAVVTDVGSTKGLLCREAHASMPEGVAFVGSHPMAGSEKTGLANAQADLFRERACLVTPLPQTPQPAVETVCRFWRGLDMEVTTMSPDRHDEIVAHISHVPHLLASALCSMLAQQDPGTWQAFAGNGLRDTTRIAAGSPTLWRDIVEQNRDEVLRTLSSFEDELALLRSSIANRDWPSVRHLLERGKHYRDLLA